MLKLVSLLKNILNVKGTEIENCNQIRNALSKSANNEIFQATESEAIEFNYHNSLKT
jgi:hypothetical protein